MDGSTDDTILEVGGDVMDEDLNDIISEVVDSVDATEPLKTCDGKPVGTVQIIPTKGPNGEVGICVNGKEICSPVGVWEIQSAPVDPAIAGEICVDSLDNNCDGKTDEGPCDCDPDMDGLITDKIKDPNFLAALRILLKKGPNDPIALNEAQLVTFFGLSGKGISDISGIECFSNAEYLNLSTNSLLSIPQLQWLIKLKNVLISNNPMITSILPLVDNVGIGAGSMVYISGNKKIPLEQVKALEAKGVFVVNN